MSNKPILIYPKQAQEMLGIGSTKFYELIKLSDFPKSRNPLGKRPMYLRKEIENWVEGLSTATRKNQD
ncbi:MAG: helix-turn-helix domain-containing protein [Legionella sp.]|uniref:helix-turn-helix transcriptional regulator n=1 Tax=Legionella sp. TaxID=459 RepID=UPI00284614CD|nr:helix-turn-helix domain-containing protein [Legionella sp.]